MKILIKDPIYGVHLNVFIGDRGDYLKWVKKTYNVELNSAEGTLGTCNALEASSKEAMINTVWLEEFKKTPTHYAILAHELYHATQFAMDRVGIPMIDGEASAYYHTYLFENALIEIDAHNKRKKARNARPKH